MIAKHCLSLTADKSGVRSISSPRQLAGAFAWLTGGRLRRPLLAGVALVMALAGAPRTAPAAPILFGIDIATLPTSGTEWDDLVAVANSTWEAPNLNDINNKNGVKALAAALVYARTGDLAMRNKAETAILGAKGTEDVARTNGDGLLALNRGITPYVYAARLIGLNNATWKTWLGNLRTQLIGSHGRWTSISQCHGNTANNWGTFAGAARAAISDYVDDAADISAAAQIFRGWLGDRSQYASFQKTSSYNASWACDDANWVPVNPPCSVDKDGIVVEDASRGGGCCTLTGSGISYVWEAMQGVVLQGLIFEENGFSSWGHSSEALRRAMAQIVRQGFGQDRGGSAGSIDRHVNHVLNRVYPGANFPTVTPSSYGRSFGYTGWLFGSSLAQVSAPTFTPVPGTYSSAQSVTISTTTSGATIRYTIDGSTPSQTNGTVYSAPVSISVTTTLKAIAYASGMADSNVTSGVYTIDLPQVAAPSFTPSPGTYSTAQSVTISTTTSGATIRYTTDGSTPSQTNGTVYSAPVSISVTTTLKAIAYASGMADSTVTTGTYTISAPASIAFSAASSAANATATTIVVPKPAAPAGSVMLATIDVRGSPTVTPPSGWTLVRQDANGSVNRKYTCWRVVSSSEPSSYTWTFSASQSATGVIVAYTGVSTSAPIAAHGGAINTSATTSAGTASISVSAGQRVVALYGVPKLVGITPASGLTERAERQANNTYDVTSEASDYGVTASGTTGSKAATLSSSSTSVTHIVALKQ